MIELEKEIVWEECLDMRDKENNLIDEHILDLVLIIKVRSELTILEFSFERVGSRCVFFILGVM